MRGVAGGRREAATGFEVAFLDPEEGEVRRRLEEVTQVAFEEASPVRAFPSYRGQRSSPGFYYAATMQAHVGFESWLERDEVMALDFDPDVIGFAAQPFWLFWPDTNRVRSHAPDFFVRHRDGTGVIVDCRPQERIKPRDEAAFAATKRACAEVGWQFRLVHGHDPMWRANVRWLAGYRHLRFRIEPVSSRLLEAFAQPRPLIDGVQSVGEPIAVLPALYHLLWSRELRTDLGSRLEASSLVARSRP
ncbi:hypothetical protein ATL45_6542 [Saccharopolyspora antimicrobica]|uniref:TnsA endonuclease N-terminal domain-containing protein n=1 Tax=Saccharopolyspora antimicrobica TaxID=455193 RepID=A0ABX9TN06_9PSEU|nr:hypothetical protein ATL45_6542 [Saccharopolyspora antimicrobica]